MNTSVDVPGAQARLSSLLPQPSHVREGQGAFSFSPSTVMTAGTAAEEAADAVRRALAVLPYALARSGVAAPEAEALHVALDDGLDAEAYRLSIRTDEIRVAAGGVAGAFYAGQTLRQLLPAAAWRSEPLSRVSWTVPCADIEDCPQLAWRGAHLDVARHFFPKHVVLRLIDQLAMHKLNRLHLHLADDQGWRVESRRFPELCARGAYRPSSRRSHSRAAPAYDGTPHGGYYSLEDLAEIHAYARQRAVTVVPEIDVPGHASALLAARPDLGVGEESRYEVAVDWGISSNILAPFPSTVDFLRAVFDEILEAVPTAYFHLGGDECVLTQWEESAAVVAYQRSLGLASASELHAYFLRQLADLLAERNCRAVMWDEAFVSGALRPDSLVTAWRGEDVARRAAEAGHDVITAPLFPTYFDFSAADDEREPLAIGNAIRLEDVAAFQPVPGELAEAATGRVVGTQFQLWSEYIPDQRSLEYMAFPRACALAEVAWTASRADWAALRTRIERHLPRLDASGVNYRPLSGPSPWQQGGTGARRHRPGNSVTEAAAHVAELAERTVSAEPSM